MIAPLLLATLLAAPGGAPPAPPAATPAQATPTPTPARPPASPAGPPGLRSDKPVRMDAEEVRFSWKTRQVLVVGKPFVTLLHDDATLTCRRLTGENDEAGKLKVATCVDEVKLVRGDRTVTCEKAVYDRVAARVVCTGNPVLRDTGGTEARGTVLTWDLAADEVRLEGAAQVTVPGGQLDLSPSRGARPAQGAATGQATPPAGKAAPPQARPAGGGP